MDLLWFLPKKKVGLVLGGGVARGIAHVGVLKVLQEHNIPIDLVVGTSSGSLIGAVYASGLDVSLIEQIVTRIRWNDFFKFTLFRPGWSSAEAIEEFIIRYVGDVKFSDLKIPFAAVATDLRTGGRVVLREGRVAKAVSASACFPGFFSPVDYESRHLVDGGIAGNVAVDTARALGATYVIASDVVPAKTRSIPADPMMMLGRSLDLILIKLAAEELGRADAVIELEMEEDLWHLDLNKARKFITAGEVSAHRQINKIRKALRA
ncbi:MAG: patatin-like phospholipase family protein [Candidatus Saganbacteria bacterium]|nr:patatin-like phospholipase family protein [Candidatus Saganbacteria bacterium]